MSFFLCRERRDSDGMKKAEAYGAEEAGRQSGKTYKTELRQ